MLSPSTWRFSPNAETERDEGLQPTDLSFVELLEYSAQLHHLGKLVIALDVVEFGAATFPV